MERKHIRVLKTPEEVPEFSGEAEEAEFWQGHSPVDIFDALPSADDEKFSPLPKRLIPLPLAEDLYEELQREARRQGVSPLTLIQRWIERGVRTKKARAKTPRQPRSSR